MISRLNLVIAISLFFSCSESGKQQSEQSVDLVTPDIILEIVTTEEPKLILHDSTFVNIKDLSSKFAFDMRYATNNNFLDTVVYECDNCLMRYEVAQALIRANDSVISLGFRVVFFDCFRPKDVQKKMWEIIPDSRYVANPYKSGSIHNKGAALDITLQRLDGSIVDMGTDFDHFGEEAHHAYLNLPKQTLQNRRLIKSVMEYFGFDAIRTEWWHYNYGERAKYSVSDQSLCE